MTNETTIALPSKGALADPTREFLQDCGLKIWKPNPRQYTGKISNIDGMNIIFQRVRDIVYKVGDGIAEFGVTGLDVVHEYGNLDEILIVHPSLEYGQCQLLVAVPESWMDVQNMYDLAEVAADMRQQQNRSIRVATTYVQSTRSFLHKKGIHHFTIAQAEGAIEAAPTLGYADIIVDLAQTGTTLRENRLRPLSDGIIIQSQACLIANRQALLKSEANRQKLRLILEYIDATLYGKRYTQLAALIKNDNRFEVMTALRHLQDKGILNPIITDAQAIFGENEQLLNLHLVVPKSRILETVEVIRQMGGTQITTRPVNALYVEHSPTYQAFINQYQDFIV